MILQALKEYYERKAADPESGIAPEGFEKKELQFLIVISEDGEFITIEDTREKSGTKLIGKSFILPRSKGRSGGKSFEITFLLWDHIGYLLGQPDDDIKSAKQHKTWLNSLANLPEALQQDTGVRAILEFYKNDGVKKTILTSQFQECLKAPQCNMAFRLSSENIPIPCRKAVKEFVKHNAIPVCTDDEQDDANNESKTGICIITGENGVIARTHGRTPINKDTKCLVGFQRNSGYDSYGKEQGYNAPVTTSTEFAYVTGLNTLLKSNSQRITIGDATTVFWSAKKTVFECDFSAIFAEPHKDNPEENAYKIKSLYESVNSGAFISDEGKSLFYVLGLAPNAARISIRFWQVGTVAEFAERIKTHFDDLSIIKPSREPEHYSIYQLLKNIAPQDEIKNIPPNIAGDFIRSILTGAPYPVTLLQAALRRIHSDTEFRVKPVRAALIKAYLNRYHKNHINPNHEELRMSLDETNPSPGYQFGRLFAVLEKCQFIAQGDINSTIVDRYYSSASSTPSVAFPILIRMNQHHLSKFENPKIKNSARNLIESIVANIGDFKPHLNLHEQGRFAIGYYHQRAVSGFSPKKETSTEN